MKPIFQGLSIIEIHISGIFYSFPFKSHTKTWEDSPCHGSPRVWTPVASPATSSRASRVGAPCWGGRIAQRCNIWLVGGLAQDFYLSIQLGISSSQLTFIFFRGVETTNQLAMAIEIVGFSPQEKHVSFSNQFT